MSREIQYDASSRAVVNTTLYAALYNSQLQIWNNSQFVELTDSTATAGNCCIAMTRIGSTAFYYANMPAGVELTQPYSVDFIDAPGVTLAPASVVGSQAITGTVAASGNWITADSNGQAYISNALSTLTVDSVSWTRMMRALIAMAGGQLTLIDNGNGTLTATLLAQDGVTTAASITYDKTSGARSAASIGE